MISCRFLSRSFPMTPAITDLEKTSLTFRLHEYEHDPSSESYGLEAADKLGVNAAQVFKTLVIKLESGELAVAVIAADQTLSMKACARHLSAKKAQMADPLLVERSTGYVLGGVSPIGQKKPLRTLLDETARGFNTIFISAGRRGLEIEIHPDHLCEITRGRYAPIGVSKK